MKKGLLLTLALGMGLTLASCGGSSKAQTFDGQDVITEPHAYTTMVTVTVKDDKITKVELKADSTHITSSEIWNADLGRPADIDAKINEYLTKFEGIKVNEIADANIDKLTGATDTGNRILRAVKDACSKASK